ncbi:MAG: hypothetical protein ACK4FB_09045 [Brevundimonas sp.]|uniref:hypothetical protein n=1 Tax=Brevundimonas sp. TaxID=1871086 RepID=UPI00391D5202
MAELPVNDRLTGPFIAHAGQRDFPADFPLLNGGVVLQRVRGETLTVLSGDALELVDEAPGGFTVRLALAHACEDGDICHVAGDMDAARPRAHAPGGFTRSDTLEADAMGLTALHQERRRDQAQALRFPFGEGGYTAPTKAARRETIPIFNAAGDLIFAQAVQVLNEIGLPFADDGPWGGPTDPLTFDDGVFA